MACKRLFLYFTEGRYCCLLEANDIFKDISPRKYKAWEKMMVDFAIIVSHLSRRPFHSDRYRLKKWHSDLIVQRLLRNKANKK